MQPSPRLRERYVKSVILLGRILLAWQCLCDFFTTPRDVLLSGCRKFCAVDTAHPFPALLFPPLPLFTLLPTLFLLPTLSHPTRDASMVLWFLALSFTNGRVVGDALEHYGESDALVYTSTALALLY